MDNFIYSLNATLPIFLMILLGKVLIKLKIIDLPFTKVVDRFVFVVALPVLLFKDLTANDLSKDFNGGYVLFCFVVTLVSISAIWFFTSIFMKNKEEQGAFIQASYRSSAAILGLAFINNMYDSTGLAPLMILGAVPLFNIFAVVILTLKGDNNGQKPDVKTTVINILKNPILLGILISLPFAFFHVQFPAFVDKALTSIGITATPLALISIGATFEGRKAIQKLKPTMIARGIKLLLLPALFLPLALYFGYHNQELKAILIMLGSPTTVSCYIMAKNTKNDALLTSSVIVLTTLLSSVTLTGWIFLLRSLGRL